MRTSTDSSRPQRRPPRSSNALMLLDDALGSYEVRDRLRQERLAHEQIGQQRIDAVVLQVLPVGPARVQSGRAGNRDRRRGVPFVLSAGVHIGVGDTAYDGDHLDA